MVEQDQEQELGKNKAKNMNEGRTRPRTWTMVEQDQEQELWLNKTKNMK